SRPSKSPRFRRASIRWPMHCARDAGGGMDVTARDAWMMEAARRGRGARAVCAGVAGAVLLAVAVSALAACAAPRRADALVVANVYTERPLPLAVAQRSLSPLAHGSELHTSLVPVAASLQLNAFMSVSCWRGGETIKSWAGYTRWLGPMSIS